MEQSWKEEPSTEKTGKDVPQPKSGMAGKITHSIGTGENAKNSIVWMTITWSFGIGAVITVAILALCFVQGKGDYVDSIKSVWAVFVPIITLALGYAFGKSK